jgi:hypothetical protein
MQTWELLVTLACREGVAQRLFVPPGRGEDLAQRRRWLEREFSLVSGGVEMVAVGGEALDKAEAMRLRDEAVIAASTVVIPVSVRPGGRFDRAVSMARSTGREVIEDFVISYERRREPLTYTVDQNGLSKEIRSFGEGYLTHWTRTSDGPWPTERRGDYYRELLEAKTYPRSAFDTVRAILRTGRIVGSGTHMPEGMPTVSFTAQPPASMAPLMRWRARYRHMSFEPYGIGVDKAWAIARGVRPVRYRIDTKGRRGASGAEAWLEQSSGSRTDWRREMEWRHAGDFDLSAVPRHRLVCVCHHAGEARSIEAECGIRSVPYGV